MRASILFLVFLAGGRCLAQEKSAEKLFAKAQEEYNAGNHSKALNLLNQCIGESPSFADAYFTRALVREQLSDFQGAHTDYSIFLELKPESTEGLLSRGAVRMKINRFVEARDDFLKLLALPPGQTNTIFYQSSASASGRNQFLTTQSSLKHLVYNYLGLAERQLKNYKQARMWIDSAIAIEPREADYFVNRALIKMDVADTSAYSDFQTTLAINPNHALALHNLSVLKRASGKPDASVELEKAIESDSTMLYPYLERAYQRLEGGNYRGALEDYNRALELESNDPAIWLNRGLVREKLNDLKGAVSDYTKAIDLENNYSKAWVNRGNAFNKLGRYKEAIEDYTVAITYQPDNGAAYYNRAIAYEKLKAYSQACPDVKKAQALGVAVDKRLRAKVCPD